MNENRGGGGGGGGGREILISGFLTEKSIFVDIMDINGL